MPKITVAGGTYSANSRQRMLIVNGQVFREGAEPVPGLVLEQIRDASAVFNFRGERFTLRF
jgi:general secretion pathway protein B